MLKLMISATNSRFRKLHSQRCLRFPPPPPCITPPKGPSLQTGEQESQEMMYKVKHGQQSMCQNSATPNSNMIPSKPTRKTGLLLKPHTHKHSVCHSCRLRIGSFKLAWIDLLQARPAASVQVRHSWGPRRYGNQGSQTRPGANTNRDVGLQPLLDTAGKQLPFSTDLRNRT